MGLDFDKSEAHWSYSGFHNFRVRLAKQFGIELNNMEGFKCDDNFKPLPGALKWDMDQPISHLLSHSDCDGHLTPDQCRIIAPVLRDAVKDWGGDPRDEYDKRQALLLAEGMELCAAEGVDLNFC